MPRINLLPQNISELIAAGEVVERPASVIKEAVENSIDANASHITVEINRGGITYMRVTDDGCGIESTDVPTAFLRHATSKIKSVSDLESIATLGFRGEALAATASVSKVEMFTRPQGAEYGTHYVIEGGKEILLEETGCQEGTTLIIRDLFYNTPARMKFLKKDVSEGTAVLYVIERAALSHPEIAFKFIRGGKVCLQTSGDGELKSAIYSVLGREFSQSLIGVCSNQNGIKVEGFTCKPVFARASKAMQFVFLNGRLVISKTVSAACEQAYKNSAMIGKFPAFVLNISVPYSTVDVNVHPAKTEVRFSDEKRIFDAVYSAVKSAIAQNDTRPVINTAKPSMSNRMSVAEYKQASVTFEEKPTYTEKQSTFSPIRLQENDTFTFSKPAAVKSEPIKTAEAREKTVKENETKEYSPESEIRFIGEAFLTYIIVERGESIFLIDKHAAHERILFNTLKASQSIEVQPLLTPVTVRLEARQYMAINENIELLKKSGFETEDFGSGTVIVRAIPAILKSEDVASVIEEAAESLLLRGNVQISEIDRIFHTVSCKAAIKAHNITTPKELLNLAKKVLSDKDVMYCPHGRPVAYEIRKKDLEKQFGRIQ